jgi:hypothetical protein
MLEKSIKDLNLDDRMYLAIHEYKSTISFFIVFMGIIGLLIGYSVLTINSNYDDSDTIWTATVLLIGTVAILIGVGAWMIIRNSRFFRELSYMQQQKIRQSYFLAIETTVPDGETSVERVYDILENVLPEMKLAKKNARKKGEKFQYDLEFKSNGEVFDLKVNTSEGIVLVEFFDKILSWDDLKGFVERIDKAFKDVNEILRVVCVSKDFDDIFLSEELSDKIKKFTNTYKIDLLKEDKTGFTTLFIG